MRTAADTEKGTAEWGNVVEESDGIGARGAWGAGPLRLSAISSSFVTEKLPLFGSTYVQRDGFYKYALTVVSCEICKTNWPLQFKEWTQRGQFNLLMGYFVALSFFPHPRRMDGREHGTRVYATDNELQQLSLANRIIDRWLSSRNAIIQSLSGYFALHCHRMTGNQSGVSEWVSVFFP